MVVARGDEAEAETAWTRRIVEVGDRERILHRVPGSHAERGVEAVAALAAVLPVLDGRARHREPATDARAEIVDLRGAHPTLAFVRGRALTARADQLARAPAAGLVRPGRCRTDGVPLRVPVDRLPVPVLLRVPVAGEDLDERLPLRVVLRGGQLLVEPGPGRRVETPGRAVRDDDRVEAPLRELLVELLRRLGRLVAIGGQRARVDARRAERHVAQLELELLEVEVALAVRPVVQRKLDALPERSHHAHRADQLAVERADRAPRHVIVVRVAEDDVLVSVVVGRRRPHLRPLPAEEGDEVGVVRVARHRVALPDGLLRLLPVARRDRLGVVVDAPEVERRAEPGEVAGVRRRVHALALQRQKTFLDGINLPPSPLQERGPGRGGAMDIHAPLPSPLRSSSLSPERASEA